MVILHKDAQKGSTHLLNRILNFTAIHWVLDVRGSIVSWARHIIDGERLATRDKWF